MMSWLRTRAGRGAIAAGLAATLAAFILLEFPEDTGAGRKLFFSAALGFFAGYGVWGMAGLPALVADMAGLVRGKGTAKPEMPVQHNGPLPELSPHKQAQVRRIVRAMAAHGLFAPEVPDPALLFAGVAEQDFPVQPDSILSALGEVDYYHPGTNPEHWMANLVMHDSHAEQDPEAQIADIARLMGDALVVSDVAVKQAAISGNPRRMQVDVAMTVNAAPVSLSYVGDVKYLSTPVHHALALAVRDGGSGKRLAWLWTDQGAWISLVDDAVVEALNAALKLTARSRCIWSWVDETPPFFATEPFAR